MDVSPLIPDRAKHQLGPLATDASRSTQAQAESVKPIASNHHRRFSSIWQSAHFVSARFRVRFPKAAWVLAQKGVCANGQWAQSSGRDNPIPKPRKPMRGTATRARVLQARALQVGICKRELPLTFPCGPSSTVERMASNHETSGLHRLPALAQCGAPSTRR